MIAFSEAPHRRVVVAMTADFIVRNPKSHFEPHTPALDIVI
jgi:hypothetical protein